MLKYLLISAAFLSLAAAAAAPRSDRGIIRQFFGYVETIRDVEYNNMLTITLNFVEYVVEGVPTKERGAATATLKNYLENGRKLLQKGSTTQQKNDHFRSLQDTFETVKSQLGANVAETEIIGMSFLALLGVAAEFAEEDEKFHAKFVDGAGKMKAKLSPATVARESELFQVIDEFINDTEFQAHEELMDRFLTFKDRY